MSEVSQGPAWWQASDGKWYPPDKRPGPATLPPPPAPPSSAYPPAAPAQAHVGDQRLSEIERNRILDRAINSRDRPLITGSMNGWLRIHEPNIKIDRSDVSAVLVWGKYFDSPGVVALLALLSFVTCGLFLPIWFYYLLRRNRYAQKVSIDEYGIQHWGLAPIPPSQRVVSVLVLIALVWWIIEALNWWHSIRTGAY